MAQANMLRKAKSLFSTTLNSGIGTGTSDTITPNSVTGLPTDTEITLTFDRVSSSGAETPSKMERITGTISGGNLTSYTRGIDGSTVQSHSAGAVIEYIWNADDWNDHIDHHLVEHNDDGTHDVAAMIIGGSVLDEDDMASNSATKLATQQSIKAYVDASGSTNGWTADTDTWVYVSATSFKITGKDVTAKFPKGTKIGLTQTTYKLFYVVGTSFSTDTTVTVTGGSDFSLANAAITSPLYSYASTPQGFPDYFNYTPTVTGFSANPPGLAGRFKVVGRSCEYHFTTSGNGTSNSTAFTYSIPITASSGATYVNFAARCVDNGTNITNAAMGEITSNATSISLTKDWNGTVFTASGGKTVYNSYVVYEI